MTGIQDDLATLLAYVITAPADSRKGREALARVEAEVARLDRIASSHISRADRREGMVVAYDYEGEYVGCIGAHTWRWLLDSGVTQDEIARLEAIRLPYTLREAWKRAETLEAEVARLKDGLREYVCAHDHRWFMSPAYAPNGCPMCNTISFRLAEDGAADDEPRGLRPVIPAWPEKPAAEDGAAQ